MIKGFVLRLNKNIAKYGLVRAIKKLIYKYEIRLVVKSSHEIDKILTKASGIVVANHPAEFDVLAILSAIKHRKDVFLIINSKFMKLVPNLDKHLIPIYIHNKSRENFEGRLKSGIFDFFHKTETFSIKEEHTKNIESIDLAIKKIKNGGLVIIFPDGGGKKEWFNGVGYLIHGIKNKKKTFITRAYINGTSNWDYLRLLPLVNKFLPKFRVSFANPLKVESIKKENPKKTTMFLEEKYWRWRGSVNLWSGLSKNYAWLKTLFLFLITKPY
jgi:1-acyl-sn-glycerol-3-phosphate acyltransferase